MPNGAYRENIGIIVISRVYST
ncbi:MAG: hypothetical protein ACR5K4_00230 [Sodalis sp. (in: enterobacteria)]